MSKDETSVMRTYQLPHFANPAKIAKVTEVLKPYQNTMRAMQSWQMRRFWQGEGFWNRADKKDISSQLSERYKCSCLNQTVAGLTSWEEICKERFVKCVTNSELSAELKTDLYRINRRGAWYRKNLELPSLDDKKKMVIVSEETMVLARLIMRHIRRQTNSIPNLGRSRTMMLDGTVAQVEKRKAGTFDYWVRVSTLEKYKPVRIPLEGYKYFNEAEGDVRNFCQVRIEKDGEAKFSLVKSSDKTELRTEGSNIGLDYGLVTLFATSAGDLLGQRLYPWLLKIDKELSILTANLQRQNIKLNDSRRYRNFQQRIRDYVENETNRCLNRAVKIHQPKRVVVESLDFRYGGLSRQLNRIMSRAGRAVVKEKLASLEETLGIEIEFTNPAYTSQECSGCNYVSQRNRKDQKFVCKFCHKQVHADVNGARTNLGRSQNNNAWLYVSRKNILSRLDEIFEARWGIPFSKVEIAHHGSNKITPKRSRAMSLLPSEMAAQLIT